MSSSALGADASAALVAQLEADLIDSDDFWTKSGIDHENGGFMCALAHGEPLCLSHSFSVSSFFYISFSFLSLFFLFLSPFSFCLTSITMHFTNPSTKLKMGRFYRATSLSGTKEEVSCTFNDQLNPKPNLNLQSSMVQSSES